MTTPRQTKPRKTKYIPAALLILLLLLAFLSGALVSGLLLTVRDNTPTIDFVIDLDDTPGPTKEPEPDQNKDSAEQSAAQSGEEEDASASSQSGSSRPSDTQASASDAGDNSPDAADSTLTSSSGRPAKGIWSYSPGYMHYPSASMEDSQGTWSASTNVLIFAAEYDDTIGNTTVRSSGGDKVVAPGTTESYYFDIKNNGQTSIMYTVDTATELTAEIGGVSYTIPLEAQFYNSDGEYLVGTSSGYSDMNDLDGMHDDGVLYTNHYTRYVLNWQWPFEGNDTFDTLLGNLSAQGEKITVTVNIRVVATGYESGEEPSFTFIGDSGLEGELTGAMTGSVSGNGAGTASVSGGIPQTGDDTNIALWLGLSICSLVCLILLLATRRKEQDEEA